MFKSSRLISLTEHDEWYSSSLSDPNRKLFIGEDIVSKIGVVILEFTPTQDQATISINLNPQRRNQGLAAGLLMKSLIASKALGHSIFYADVKINNKPSLKCFQQCGFKIIRSDNDYFYLVLKPSSKTSPSMVR
jgi:RimJ/RimL family protein N-acetyltransferase